MNPPPLLDPPPTLPLTPAFLPALLLDLMAHCIAAGAMLERSLLPPWLPIPEDRRSNNSSTPTPPGPPITPELLTKLNSSPSCSSVSPASLSSSSPRELSPESSSEKNASFDGPLPPIPPELPVLVPPNPAFSLLWSAAPVFEEEDTDRGEAEELVTAAVSKPTPAVAEEEDDALSYFAKLAEE